MSTTDEIVFGDVSYREPERRRRPDRDRKWACLAYEVPGPGDLPIFLDRAAADRIERHALRDTGVELGGILLGKECVDDRSGEPFVWVTEALEAKHFENTQASFTYTHDSWEEINRERDRLHPGLDIVGWYHTHPDFGVFLSGHDRFIHEHFFAQPLQVAYVVDPVRQTRGFFRWRGGALDEVGGYFLTAERGERIALARTANELEGLVGAEGAATSALSPRLEAELMAALTRTHHAPPAAAERAQLAVLAGLLGALGGALALGLAIWLYTLGGQILEQKQALDGIGRAVAKDRDAARVAGKEEALDALLGELQVGDHRERASKVLAGLARDRDEARAEARRKGDVFDRFADELGRLRTENSGQKAKLVALTEQLSKAEAKAVREDPRRDDAEPGARDGAADEEGGRTNWYVAAGGWASSLVLALALMAALLRGRPESVAGPDEPPKSAG